MDSSLLISWASLGLGWQKQTCRPSAIITQCLQRNLATWDCGGCSFRASWSVRCVFQSFLKLESWSFFLFSGPVLWLKLGGSLRGVTSWEHLSKYEHKSAETPCSAYPVVSRMKRNCMTFISSHESNALCPNRFAALNRCTELVRTERGGYSVSMRGSNSRTSSWITGHSPRVKLRLIRLCWNWRYSWQTDVCTMSLSLASSELFPFSS